MLDLIVLTWGALLGLGACVLLLVWRHELLPGEDEQDRRIRRKVEAALRRDRR